MLTLAIGRSDDRRGTIWEDARMGGKWPVRCKEQLPHPVLRLRHRIQIADVGGPHLFKRLEKWELCEKSLAKGAKLTTGELAVYVLEAKGLDAKDGVYPPVTLQLGIAKATGAAGT